MMNHKIESNLVHPYQHILINHFLQNIQSTTMSGGDAKNTDVFLSDDNESPLPSLSIPSTQAFTASGGTQAAPAPTSANLLRSFDELIETFAYDDVATINNDNKENEVELNDNQIINKLRTYISPVHSITAFAFDIQFAARMMTLENLKSNMQLAAVMTDERLIKFNAIMKLLVGSYQSIRQLDYGGGGASSTGGLTGGVTDRGLFR